MSPNLFVELREHIDTIAQQTEEVGCVILRGEGRSFSAGNDIKAIQRESVRRARTFRRKRWRPLNACRNP